MNKVTLTARKIVAVALLGLGAAVSIGVYCNHESLAASAERLISQEVPKPTATPDTEFKIVGVKDGIMWGTGTMDDSGRNGVLQYSVAKVGSTGYFYGSYEDTNFPETYFANLVQPSACGASKTGYKGFQSLAEVGDVSKLTYTTTNSILLGDKESGCYTGLLVIRQETEEKNGQFMYMVIEPIDVDNTSLKVRWWASVKAEATDFSQAPDTF